MHKKRQLMFSMLLMTILLLPAVVLAETDVNVLTIKAQGSFAVGGKVITNPGTFDSYNFSPAGQTYHGDHAYVFYQVPVDAKELPLVFLHGAGQFSKTWETTPDGR